MNSARRAVITGALTLDAGAITLISLGITTVGGIVLAWIAFKTAQLNKKVDVVQEQTNGILLATTKAKDVAEGRAEAAVEIAVKLPPTPPI